LTKAIAEDPGDKDAILSACGRLPAPPDDALAQLVGDWKVEWSSMQSRPGKPPGEASRVPPGGIKLRFLSFGALPDVEVCIVGGYNRISGSVEGGVYELFQVFTVPGSEGVTAAMVLGGPWGAMEPGEPRRASVHFQTVTLVPSADDKERSVEMLKAAGLGVLTPIPVKAPPTYIDVEYIDGGIRVHKGESGMTYVLSRGAVPFASAWQ